MLSLAFCHPDTQGAVILTDAVELRLAQFPHVEHVGEAISIQGFNQTFSRWSQHVVVKHVAFQLSQKFRTIMLSQLLHLPW